MCQTIEEISKLLETEKKRIEQEKRENEKKNRELIRKEKIEKAKKLSHRWAMYRWVTEYIDENYEKWEQEQEKREKEAQEDLELWEHLTRYEKIEKLQKEQEQITNEKKTINDRNEKQDSEKNWTKWRNNAETQSKTRPNPPETIAEKPEQNQTRITPNKEIQLFPIFKKFRSPTKFYKNKPNEENPSTENPPNNSENQKTLANNTRKPTSKNKKDEKKQPPTHRPNQDPVIERKPEKLKKIHPIFTQLKPATIKPTQSPTNLTMKTPGNQPTKNQENITENKKKTKIKPQEKPKNQKTNKPKPDEKSIAGMKKFWVNLAANNRAKKLSNQVHHDNKLPELGCDNMLNIDKIVSTQATQVKQVSKVEMGSYEKLPDNARCPVLISNKSESNYSKLLSKVDNIEPGISKERQENKIQD